MWTKFGNENHEVLFIQLPKLQAIAMTLKLINPWYIVSELEKPDIDSENVIFLYMTLSDYMFSNNIGYSELITREHI